MTTLRRRDFLAGGAALSLAATLPKDTFAQAAAPTTFAPKPNGWRRFEITTRLEIANPAGTSQAWIPLPSISESDWIRPMGNVWSASTMDTAIYRDAKSGADMLHVAWSDAGSKPSVEVTSRFATRDRAVDLTASRKPQPLSAEQRAYYTSATALQPTDGIVKATADKITAGAKGDQEKARHIYEWIVVNTQRNAATRGCGIGDIASMLKNGNLTGKCADLNALFVGLARASGIPARDLYGIRVAPSKFGYKSLGAGSENITKAQHCRSEVWLENIGWVPADPADVRKVMLEEPPTNLAIDNPMVVNARKALFGAWETNWLAYNQAHDVALPGSQGPKVDFLMYPQAETAAGRLDCLDPDTFKYTITTKELSA